MSAGPRDIFFGVGEAFIDLVLSTVPFVTQPGFRTDACAARDQDFVELFSGAAKLTDGLRNESVIDGKCLSMLIRV